MNRRILSLAMPFCLVAAALAANERRAAWYVPADAFVAIGYDGSHPGIQATTLHQFMAEPEVAASLAQWRPLVNKALDAIDKESGLDIGPALRMAVGCDLVVGLVAKPEKQGEPGGVLAAHVGAAGTPARNAVEKLVKGLLAKAKADSAKTTKVGAAQVTTFVDKDGEPHCVAFDGEFFLATDTEALARRALAADGEKLAARLGAERPVLRMRYDHQAMLKGLGAEIDAEGRRTLDALGISAVRTIEMTVVPRGRRLVTQVTMDMPDAAKLGGVAKWFVDAPPADRELLKRVPATATLFWQTSMNAAGLWDGIWEAIAKGAPDEVAEAKEGLAEFEGKLGLKVRDAFLAPLDRGTVVLANRAGGLLSDSLVVVQRVKDGRALERGIAQLVNRLDLLLMDAGGQMGAVRTALKPFRYRGHTCFYLWIMGAPALGMPGWAPCYAKLGDVFVFAKHPLDLKDYLDFVADKAPSVLDNAEFRTLLKAVPQNATSISYGNWTEAVVALYNTVAPFTMLFQGFHEQLGIPQGIDVANMPSSRLIRRYSRGTVSYSVMENGRYRLAMEGDGVEFLSPHVAPIAGGAILAGMLLPALSRARGEARRVTDMNNLRQIGMACQAYQAEHNRYPSGLSELVAKGMLRNKEALVSKADDAPPKLRGGLPSSYMSCFDKFPKREFSRDFPVAAMMVWDRQAFFRGRRNVLFFDTHVESVDEARFAQLLRELEAHVKQHTKDRKAATEF